MKLTQKQETFILNLYSGMNQYDAYSEAGYAVAKQTRATIDSNASRLANNVKVLARLDEMRQAAKSALIVDEIERKEILSEIARGRLTDYITCGPDRDLIDVGPESPNTAAFQEITSRTEFDKDGAGVAVITKLKLHSNIQAIAELNKMEHIYEATAPGFQDNRVINIIVSSERAKELTENVARRLMGETK